MPISVAMLVWPHATCHFGGSGAGSRSALRALDFLVILVVLVFKLVAVLSILGALIVFIVIILLSIVILFAIIKLILVCFAVCQSVAIVRSCPFAHHKIHKEHHLDF